MICVNCGEDIDPEDDIIYHPPNGATIHVHWFCDDEFSHCDMCNHRINHNGETALLMRAIDAPHNEIIIHDFCAVPGYVFLHEIGLK